MNTKTHMDKTEYARALGYTGTKPVIVSDGRVVSHRNRDWFSFCASLQKKRKL